jgi:phage terminase small subunit
MTDLQKRFAEEYTIDYHITDAGKRAGIQGDNIRITAWQMLQLPEVQAYVEELQAEAAKRCQITKDEWLNEWKKIGFSSITNYMEDDLEIKALSNTKDPEVIKSIKKTVTDNEFGSKTSIEFTLHDKATALQNIGKHLGYYEEDNKQSKPNQVINFQPIVKSDSPPLADSEK